MFNAKRAERIVRTDTPNTTSLMAGDMTIRGDVHFSGRLHVDGRIEGAVAATDEGAVLTVGNSGAVQGDIRVPQAVIHGQVLGNIHASDHLELAAEARVAGDIHYRNLVIAAGAQVNGRMTRDADATVEVLPATLPVIDDALAG